MTQMITCYTLIDLLYWNVLDKSRGDTHRGSHAIPWQTYSTGCLRQQGVTITLVMQICCIINCGYILCSVQYTICICDIITHPLFWWCHNRVLFWALFVLVLFIQMYTVVAPRVSRPLSHLNVMRKDITNVCITYQVILESSPFSSSGLSAR